jgi:CDP-glucose 4,6-dehydratase
LYSEGDDFAGAWNFGPKDEDCQSVEWILNKMINTWGDGASWELDTNNNPHEAGYLKLDCSKAAQQLNWAPHWNLDYTLNSIVHWHKAWLDHADMKKYCLNEISLYLNIF